MFFISLQKLFSFSRKSTFRILDIEVSWRNQMPKHKARNTFYWITWEINTLIIKFGQFVSYYKKKFIKRFYKNCDLKTSSRPFCVRKELSTTSVRKWNFWSKLLRYVWGKLSRFAQISTHIPQIPFYEGFFET